MSNVLKADAAADDAWAEIDLGSNQSGVWVTYQVAFAPDALAFWETMGNFSGNFVELLANDDSDQLETLTINPDGWYDYYFGTIPTPAPVADVWVTVEINRTTLGTVSVYFDGTLAAASVDIDANDTRFVRFGQSSALTDAAAVAYIRDVKVGTARHGSNLFAWPDSSVDLSGWTSTFGAVSVVANPFVSPVTGSVAWPITVTFSVRGDAFSLIPVTTGTLTLTPSSDGTLTLVPV